MRTLCRLIISGTLAFVLEAGHADHSRAADTWLSPEAERDASRLVAMLSSTFEDGERVGAGIIFGYGADVLHIATVNHNVRWGKAQATHLQVWLNGNADEPLEAKLSSHFDAELDLAVLTVVGFRKIGLDLSTIPFDRLGDPHDIQRADYVFPMGNPYGRAWAISFTPDRLSGKHDDRLYFESSFIAPGHSGGALFDEHLHVVGMIRSDQPPHGEALSISKVLERVKDWGYPVQLGLSQKEMHFAHVATGSDHACGLTTSGDAYCFGENAGGRLGAGTSTPGSDRLRRVVGEHRFRVVEVGRDFSCGLDNEGLAWCWGSNVFGELGTGSPDTRETSYEEAPVAVAGGHRFETLSAGTFSTCALTRERVAWCWGDLSGQYRSPRHVPGAPHFVSVHAADQDACGITEEGQVFCWSLNLFDPTAPKEPHRLQGEQHFKTIAVGYTYLTGCGVAVDGSAFCWGKNVRGQLGNGRGGELTLANDSSAPVRVSGEHAFASVSVGEQHACGVTLEGEAWCWGANENGQLGDGTQIDRNTPVAVKGGLAFPQLSAGSGMTCGVTTSGIIYCWGKVHGRMTLEPLEIVGQGRWTRQVRSSSPIVVDGLQSRIPHHRSKPAIIPKR